MLCPVSCKATDFAASWSNTLFLPKAPLLNKRNILMSGRLLAWTGRGEQCALIAWLTDLTRGWAGVKQAFCLLLLSYSTSLQTECWCTSLFSGSLLTERVPFCPWWGGPSAAQGHFQEHEKGCQLFSISDKILCSFNALRSLRVRSYQQFALEKEKCTISLVCAKASILMWQQKYWDSYVWHPVCPWNIYSTLTVCTLCSHCIICLET